MSISDLVQHPAFGSFAAIARVCTRSGRALSREAVRHWKQVPPEFCIAIEQATGGDFTRYELRPDVFGASRTGNRAETS
jgi:DNA-binding transcriptional regulator YdaS (Cro superfamily)